MTARRQTGRDMRPDERDGRIRCARRDPYDQSIRRHQISFTAYRGGDGLPFFPLSLFADFRRYIPAVAKVTPAAACWNNQLASLRLFSCCEDGVPAPVPFYQAITNLPDPRHKGGWVIQVRVSCERYAALVLRQVRERERAHFLKRRVG